MNHVKENVMAFGDNIWIEKNLESAWQNIKIKLTKFAEVKYHNENKKNSLQNVSDISLIIYIHYFIIHSDCSQKCG